jgi:hypothetical protein
MLTFLPVALLVLTALAVYLLRFLRRGTRYAYLLAVLAAFLIWGGVLALHWFPPAMLRIPPWRPFSPSDADEIQFLWDSVSWPYAFSLMSAVLAVLLTAGARLKLNSNPITWAANLVLAGIGLTAVLAATPLALLLSLTLLDIFDFLLVIRLSRGRRSTTLGVMAFSVRTISSLIIIAAMAVQQVDGTALTYENMQPAAAVLIFLAIGLRLSFLPLNTPYSEDFPFQRGLVSFVRLTAHAAGLAALARLSAASLPDNWSTIFLIVAAIACLYGAAMWLFALDELKGRPFWLLTLSGLAFISVLRAQPQASIAWGVVMVTSGIALFIFSARTRGLTILLLISVLALSGLPFTPAAPGWLGLVPEPIDSVGILSIVVVALLLAGNIRHSLRSGQDLSKMEGWVRGTYPIGFFLVILSSWVAAFLGNANRLILGAWLPAIISTLLAILLWQVHHYWLTARVSIERRSARLVAILKWIGRTVASVFSLNWFYEFLGFVFQGLRRMVYFLTVLFEGEGGMMWAFVLLVLLITLLGVSGTS